MAKSAARTVKSTGSSAASGKTAKTRKRPVKPAMRDEAVIQDARRMLRVATKYQSRLHKAKPKLFTPALLKTFSALIHQTTTAISQHATESSAARAATAEKRALLGRLVESIKEIRDEVAAAGINDRQLRAAFGTGKRLAADVAQNALALAAAQQEAFAHATFGPKAREIGITQARINSLIAQRRAVAAAQSQRDEAVGTKKGERATKQSLLRDLARQSTRLLKIGKLVFRGDPKVLAEFTTRRKLAVRPRKKPAQPTPPAAGASPAAAAPAASTK